MTSSITSTLVNGDSLDGPLFAELDSKEPAEQVKSSAILNGALADSNDVFLGYSWKS